MKLIPWFDPFDTGYHQLIIHIKFVIVILAELVSSLLRYFVFFPVKAEKIGNDDPQEW